MSVLVWKWDGAALVWWAKLEDGTEMQARDVGRGRGLRSWVARVVKPGGLTWESGRHHGGADAAQDEARAHVSGGRS